METAMRKSLLALTLVAACGAMDQGTQNQSGGDGAAVNEAATPRPAGASSGLTGLYEGQTGVTTDQLCFVDRGRDVQFGLVIWGANMHSCSGSGKAVRSGDTLRLEMAGDETCRIEAKMEGGVITLPDNVPDGCSYYCGARAQLTGASFTRKGSSAADAAKAKDLAGDPLCGAAG
jgi:hypothetical protein